jgi:hypothetical protein
MLASANNKPRRLTRKKGNQSGRKEQRITQYQKESSSS